ncbi:hypothetical protein KAH55_08645, partial [bacterium]|nr:hypothetical protein [bacterium]
MKDEKPRIDDYELFSVIYKKHRYWLTVFYIITIGLFIALRGIEAESKQIVTFRKNIEFITTFHENQTLKSYIGNPTVPFPIILKKRLNYKGPHKWERIETHNSKYKHQQRLIISSLSEMSEYPDSSNTDLFLSKCAFVLDQMTHNHITSLLNSTDNSLIDKKWRESRNEFTQAVNDSISNVFDLYLQNSLVPFFYQKYEL